MLFTAPSFLFVFLPVVLALHLVPHPVWRNALLLVASVVFYASGAGAFTTLILASIAGNYVAALAIDRWRDGAAGRWLLRGAIAANLAVLASLGMGALPVPAVTLPIGISFLSLIHI